MTRAAADRRAARARRRAVRRRRRPGRRRAAAWPAPTSAAPTSYLVDHGDHVMRAASPAHYEARAQLTAGRGRRPRSSCRRAWAAWPRPPSSTPSPPTAATTAAEALAGRRPQAAEARALAEADAAPPPWIGAAGPPAGPADAGPPGRPRRRSRLAARRHLDAAQADDGGAAGDGLAPSPQAEVAMNRAAARAALDLERAGLELARRRRRGSPWPPPGAPSSTTASAGRRGAVRPGAGRPRRGADRVRRSRPALLEADVP
jgi:hypothetical protein